MTQEKSIIRRMTGVASIAVLAVSLLFQFVPAEAKSGMESEGTSEPSVLFLGNESLPPMNYIKDGKPTGIIIDLAGAIAAHMHHPVQIQLMNWTEAQKLVLEGRADALMQINSNQERLKDYDFSEPLLDSEFTIFVSVDRLGVSSMKDLRGLKVGVEEKGLPILLLQEDHQIILKTIPDFAQGFKMLVKGDLDAVVADRWVGSYVLAENNIQGVKVIDEPIGRSQSAIAVKKGNINLLSDINVALTNIRQDGTYDRIIKSWQPKEVVFKTREQMLQQKRFIVVVSGALLIALVCVAVLVREIRRRKRLEKTLKESEGQLRLFIEHAPASLAMFDREMRYLSASHRWMSDFNLGVHDLKGKSHYEIFPEIPDRWKEIHRRGLSGEIMRSDADLFKRANGDIQWLRWEVRPWHNAAGEVGGILIFSEDITERKNQEEELRRSKEELELRVNERTSELSDTVKRLEQLNTELQEFSHVASHDLQEPLRKIQTFSDLALKRYSKISDSLGEEYLARVVNSASRMRQILHDLLQHSRLSVVSTEEVNSIDLTKAVEEAADLFDDQLKSYGGMVDIQNMPVINANEAQMIRLFQNLIGNALKYRSRESPVIRIHSKQNKEFCEIFIEDNGIGFEQEYAERIFKPFQRLHGRHEYEGTGMGLAICRKIVQRYGGSIRAESQPAKGSLFIIRLPMKQQVS